MHICHVCSKEMVEVHSRVQYSVNGVTFNKHSFFVVSGIVQQCYRKDSDH